MSKKKFFFGFAAFLAFSLLLQPGLWAQPERIAMGEKALAEKNWEAARAELTASFDSGYFTEKMLYQLAQVHEQLGEYPLAVFYLRKVNQEFGGPLLEDKIRYLVQMAGGRALYSSSGWDGFLRSLSRWQWLLWALFLPGALLLTLSLSGVKLPASAMLSRVKPLLFSVALLSAGLLFTRLFLVPERAVVVVTTPAYEQPGYGGHFNTEAISPGETVDVLEESDIWVRVQAGAAQGWLPGFTLKRL